VFFISIIVNQASTTSILYSTKTAIIALCKKLAGHEQDEQLMQKTTETV